MDGVGANFTTPHRYVKSHRHSVAAEEESVSSRVCVCVTIRDHEFEREWI